MYSTFYSNDSNDSKIVYKKPSSDKITLIFDLDETFITRINAYMYQNNYMTLGPHRFSIIKYKYPYKNTDGKKQDDYETELIAIRPGFIEFKNFLLDNMSYFNIGFWSFSYHTRAKAIVDLLFPELNKNISIFIGREEEKHMVKGYVKQRDMSHLKKSNTHAFYDVLKNKIIKLESHLNGNVVKRVDVLCDLPEYRDVLHKNRTILIDDLPENVIVNHPKNTIWVNIWNFNYTCDDTLKKLMKWLDKHKNMKSFTNIKMPNYAKNSIFNTIIVDKTNPLEKAVEIQKKCNLFYKELNRKSTKTQHPVAKTKEQIERKLKRVLKLNVKKTKKVQPVKKAELDKAKKSKKH
jgi:hypothetical protein